MTKKAKRGKVSRGDIAGATKAIKKMMSFDAKINIPPEAIR